MGMKRIIDKRASGKTSRLMLLAKEAGGIIVCANPQAMQDKAYAYGITGIDFISYSTFKLHGFNYDKPIFIDELDMFLNYTLSKNIVGYTISNED